MGLSIKWGGVMPKMANFQNNVDNQLVTDDPNVAYDWLIQGKLLAYPTESVWGLGCDAFNEQAVNELLTLKNRPTKKGLIVLTATDFYVWDFLKNLPPSRQHDIITSWDYDKNRRQATTWLFDIPDKIHIPQNVRGEHTSLAIRVINHAKVSKVCDLLATNKSPNRFGFLVSTSCNPNGESPARDFATAYEYFGDKVCYLLGDTLGFDKPSQIKDSRTGELLRV